MTLRTRLLLGYALLVLLLVATGAAGSYGFREITVLADERLEHFTTTTRDANTMLRAVETEDRELLRALLDEDPTPHVEAIRDAEAQFIAALDVATQMADGEQAVLLAHVRDARPTYAAARERVLAKRGTAETAAVAALYASDALPAMRALRAPCLALFETSRSHMFTARDDLRAAARDGSILLGVLVTVGLLSLIALARSMRTHVLERLEELQRFSEAIAEGDDTQRALLGGSDELSRMAAQMNAMLDRQVALEGRLEGRLAQDREMLIGILHAYREGVLLLSPSGELITWTGPFPDPATVDALAQHARQRNHERVHDDEVGTLPEEWQGPEGRTWRLHLLHAAAGRARGWLAEPLDTAGGSPPLPAPDA